jgi:hypothetical protein
MSPKKTKSTGKGTVQRPDLAGVYGTGDTEETHLPGEHRPEDAPGGEYTGAHGGTLPTPDPKVKKRGR